MALCGWLTLCGVWTSVAAADADAGWSAQVLLGRRHECATLDQLLTDVRAGHSRALAIRGDAGVGKSVLLEHVAAQATGCRVVRGSGVESEMELAFAGLHQFCAPLLDLRVRLPVPQRDALETAFGLSAGESPDRFFVGLGVLGLLSEAAEGLPVVCLVDDAQWLDRVSAQTLAFVARRLVAESVAMVFAVRDQNGHDELEWAPRARRPRPSGPRRACVAGRASAGAARRQGARSGRRRGPRQPAGVVGVAARAERRRPGGRLHGAGRRGLSGRIEESFVRRLETLPEATQLLALIAAAEPVGDPVVILRAAARLDVFREAAEPAHAAGLLTFGAHVRFRHPLVRSAVYGAASQEERQLVHRALGEATDPELDPDRRAWHRAQAATGPDEDVAGELERSAGRARARGGYAAAAAFLERALELTLDPAHRARRALDAAQFKRLAGAPEAALELLAMAQTGSLSDLQRARVDLMRGQIAFSISHGSEAPPLLLSAARQLESLDDGLARETYRDALSAALYAGRASDAGPLDVARAVRAMPPAKNGARAIDLLLQGAALLFTDGPATAVPLLRRGLTAFRDTTMPAEERLRWIWLACRMAHNIWDADHWNALSAEYLQLARETGAASALTHALGMRAGALLFAGELTAAWSLVLEEDSLNQAMGIGGSSYPGVSVAAWQGREAEVRARVEGATAYAVKSGHGQWMTLVHWASSALYNGLGRYDDALREAEQAVEIPREHAIATWAIEIPREYGLASWALPELVEAAMRTGRTGSAAPALERLARMTRAGGADWGLGVEAMSRALMTDEEELYQEAIERLDRPATSAFHARAELLYGEWLRRERRRLDARRHLSRRARQVHGDGRGRVRRPGRARAAGDGRDRSQAHRREPRRAHAAGGADRAARLRGPLEPGDRGAPVHQPAHGPVPPAQGLRQARHRLAHRAQPRARRLGSTPPETPFRAGSPCLEAMRLVPFSAEHLDAMAEVIFDDDVRRYTGFPEPPDLAWLPTLLERYERGREEGARAGFAVLDARRRVRRPRPRGLDRRRGPAMRARLPRRARVPRPRRRDVEPGRAHPLGVRRAAHAALRAADRGRQRGLAAGRRALRLRLRGRAAVRAPQGRAPRRPGDLRAPGRLNVRPRRRPGSACSG